MNEQTSTTLLFFDESFFKNKMEIHEKIRAIRQAKAYTQDYIADKLGIDTVNYGRIERGQAKLYVDRLQQICDILDIKVSSLFKEEFNESKLATDLFEKIYNEVQEINRKINC